MPPRRVTTRAMPRGIAIRYAKAEAIRVTRKVSKVAAIICDVSTLSILFHPPYFDYFAVFDCGYPVADFFDYRHFVRDYDDC